MVLKLKVQILSGGELAIGPGKAELLAAIAATGSISAAGRTLGFSYRRTWMMVDTMNRCWCQPLIATVHGGARGGGATLTTMGASVLGRYLALQRTLAAAGESEAASLEADVLSMPRASQKH